MSATSQPPSSLDASNKIAQPEIERCITAEEARKTEVLEDDGEVFKSHTGHDEYRALGW